MSEGLHPGVHPDPDALNAFLEGALPEHDRVECLSHLAECAQCREVVFLAQQAVEIEEPVTVPEAPVSFWRRLLRPMAVGSVVAALIVGVVSFGLHRMIRSVEPQRQVTTSTKPPVEAAKATPAPEVKAEEQPPELPPPTKKASPPPVPREQEKPPAETAPAPVAAPPTVVAAAPRPSPPPAAVVAADTGGVVTPAAEAGVVGTITDPAGSIIASARVELKNEETGATFASTSDARGQYSIAGLPPGRYDFSVTVPGFKKFVRPGLNVPPQEIARLDSPLQVGASTESVTVTAEASLLKTESGELAQNVGLTSLNDLPLSTGARGNFPAVTGASPAYTLPDKSTPVSVAAKDKVVVAVDSGGALLVSENAGKNWTRVKATWKGKVVHVGVSASAMFELTTDPASTWVSIDGQRWSEARASR